MKKILLSSIIMLGVCGAVSAQNATGSKLGKNNQTTTSAAAPTPQKAAVMPASDVAAPTATDPIPSDARTAADKEAAATAPAAKTKAQVKAEQAAAAAAVNADGTAMTAEQKEKAAKAEAEKAQNVKKNQQ